VFVVYIIVLAANVAHFSMKLITEPKIVISTAAGMSLCVDINCTNSLFDKNM
jgi:hypothetical protein